MRSINKIYLFQCYKLESIIRTHKAEQLHLKEHSFNPSQCCCSILLALHENNAANLFLYGFRRASASAKGENVPHY